MEKSSDPTSHFDLTDLMKEFDVLDDEILWPKFEVKKNKDGYEVVAVLDGFLKDDIFIDLTEKYLCISSPKQGAQFKKEFHLPFVVDLQNIDVKMEDGKFQLKLKRAKKLKK